MSKKLFPVWFGLFVVEAVLIVIIPLPTFASNPLMIAIYCLILAGFTLMIIQSGSSKSNPSKYLFVACTLLQLGLYLFIFRLFYSGVGEATIMRTVGLLIYRVVGAKVTGLIGIAFWIGLIIVAVKLMPKPTLGKDLIVIHRVTGFIFFFLVILMPVVLIPKYLLMGQAFNILLQENAILVTGFILTFLPLEVLRIATVKTVLSSIPPPIHRRG